VGEANGGGLVASEKGQGTKRGPQTQICAPNKRVCCFPRQERENVLV
jgi:hypothetical protein